MLALRQRGIGPTAQNLSLRQLTTMHTRTCKSPPPTYPTPPHFTPMPPRTGPADTADIEADFWRELAEIEAEAIGWQPLGDGCYLHTGADTSQVLIVGTASASMAGHNVLWVY